jgi:penicillin-binding protein 2
MRLTVPHESGRIDVSQADIDVIKRGMENVTSNPSGTAYEVFRNAPYTVAGKTGTAQVFSLQGAKYHGGALAERLRDHSLFIAFAPADHPVIAVATIVENGGWGASVAGPLVRRVLDYYLLQRGKPGVLQAAVAQAASASQATAGPVIGASEADGKDSTASPVRVAAGFKALPMPVVPASAPRDASSSPLIASDVVAASQAASAPTIAASAPDVSAASAAGPAKGDGASAGRPAAPASAPSARPSASEPRVSAVEAMRRLREGTAARAAAGSAAPRPHKRRTAPDAAASAGLGAPRESSSEAQAPTAATPAASGPNE